MTNNPYGVILIKKGSDKLENAHEKQALIEQYFRFVDVFNDYSRAIELLDGERPAINFMLDTLRQLANKQVESAMALTKFGFKDTNEIWREFHNENN